jgi:hypothetical protein
MRTRLNILVGAVMLVAALPSFADESAATKITRAMSAAPSNISAGATIMDVDGTVLREGDNGWTCMPGIGPGDDHPMCNDAVWVRLMAAAGAGADFQTDRIGLSYMLQGDAHVNNADPSDTEQNEGEVWVQEGPHLMVVVPKAALQGVSDDPYNGGPYVMWGDTPYAHIMVPTTNDKLR